MFFCSCCLFLHFFLFTPSEEKQLNRSTRGISSGSPTVAQPTAKQCIFYPVKEEEGELLVEPQINNQGASDSDVSEERTEPCKINKCLKYMRVWKWNSGKHLTNCPLYQSVGGAPGLDQCEIRIACPQMEMHPNLYSSTEEGK